MESADNEHKAPLRGILDPLFQFSQQCAELEEIQRRVMEYVFLFGIAIGRAQQLTPAERRIYAKTLNTVRFLTLLEDPSLAHDEHTDGNRKSIANAVKDWLHLEPEVRKALEGQLKLNLSDSTEASGLSSAMHLAMIKLLRSIAAASPGAMSEEELKSILEKLKHPLDRA